MELYVSSLSDRASDKATHQIYAIKHVIPDNEGVISNQLAITSFREIEILLSIDHPYIAKLIEVVTGRKGVFLVLEYGGRDLAYLYDSSASRASLLHHPSPTLYTEIQIKKFIRDLLRAVAYLHQQGIIHRDLKLSNLLIDEENNLKLCDFGLARRYARILTPNVVTLWYRAPEILLGCRDYTQAIDMWSVGCIFAEMLNNGKPILPGNNEADQFQLICKLIGEPNENIWPRYAEIRHSFSVPRNPYNTLNLLFSNYSHECLDFLNSLLVWDPSKRLTASEALLNSYLAY